MIDRKARALVAAAAAFLLLGLLITAPVVRADWNGISGTRVVQTFTAQSIALGTSATQTKAFTFLGNSLNQVVQVTGTGTAPNYKVEILCEVDGSTFAKPETGGDLGTFTDQLTHIIAVSTPLCEGHKLKITNNSGANAIVIDAWERSQ